MIKKALAAAATLAIGIVGFAPTSSAQTIGGCTNPNVCGFINASGFLILGFADNTFGFIGGSAPYFPTFPSNTQTTAAAPAPAPSSALGQWNFGSLPLPPQIPAPNTQISVPTPQIPAPNTQISVPDISSLLASLPEGFDFDFDFVDSTSPVAASDGFDAAAVAPVVVGLIGLYGVLMVTVRRRGALTAV